jgi:hypothetical protein
MMLDRLQYGLQYREEKNRPRDKIVRAAPYWLAVFKFRSDVRETRRITVSLAASGF